MFKMKIIPVSAGTPQEMAYAERAVQTLAQMSRALMAGAPHLPGFCWRLGDIYAAHISTKSCPRNRRKCSARIRSLLEGIGTWKRCSLKYLGALANMHRWVVRNTKGH
jgi:hypothetical protein